MPRVVFTRQLERFLQAPAAQVAGATVHEALQQVFAGNPELRRYVLDDQGELRQHVAVFVDGSLVRDRRRLSDPVEDSAEIFVMQALSGG